jgi:hypothetical protein
MVSRDAWERGGRGELDEQRRRRSPAAGRVRRSLHGLVGRGATAGERLVCTLQLLLARRRGQGLAAAAAINVKQQCLILSFISRCIH